MRIVDKLINGIYHSRWATCTSITHVHKERLKNTNNVFQANWYVDRVCKMSLSHLHSPLK